MNRRDLVASSFLSLVLGHMMISPKMANAQTLPTFDAILKGLEISFEDFQRLSRLSRNLIELRFVYQGPNGYENLEWRIQALAAWESAFESRIGESIPEFFEQSVTMSDQILNSDFGQIFTSNLFVRFEENEPAFSNWCTSIGISTGSDLYNDLISSQALFAAQFLSQNQEIVFSGGGASFFDSFTWIWPFCGGG